MMQNYFEDDKYSPFEEDKYHYFEDIINNNH